MVKVLSIRILLAPVLFISVVFEIEHPSVFAQSSIRSNIKSRTALVAQLGHSQAITSVAFSSDGKYALTGSSDHSARLWDTATGKELRVFVGHSDGVSSVAFSPSGKQVLAGSDDGSVMLWDAMTGIPETYFIADSGFVRSVAFSPDGRNIITGSADDEARIWDLSTGKTIRKFTGHANQINSVAYSPDGLHALTGSADHTVRLWNVATGMQIRKYVGHTECINSVAFSPDGKQILTGSWDKTARLWDVSSGREIRKLEGHTESVNCVAYSTDKRWVLTGSLDASARIWDSTTGKEIRKLSTQFEVINSVAFSSDGKSILTGTSDGRCRRWDSTTGLAIGIFEGYADSVETVEFASNQKFILSSSTTVGGVIWDSTSRNMRQFSSASSAISRVAYSPDAKQIVVGSTEGPALLCNTTTGDELQRFIGHTARINAAAFSPDGSQVLTGSGDPTVIGNIVVDADNSVRLWDVKSGTELRRFSGHTKAITSVTFSPTGKWVLTGSEDATVRLWNTKTGKEIWRLENDSKPVCTAIFSPDSKSVLTGGQGNSANLWDATTGKQIRRFAATGSFVHSVAFSPDGKYVVTGNQDQTVQVWDASTGAKILEFVGHTGVINSVAFSSNGKMLLTGSSDGTMRILDVASGKELCRMITFANGTWAVTDSHGRFDASNAGDVEGLHWVVGNEPVSLNQLKERYYEPGLLSKVLGFNKERLRDVSDFSDPKLYPDFTLDKPTVDSPVLRINLKNRGGGIGRVVVKINGKELSADARKPNTNANVANLSLAVDLRNDPRLKLGEANEIEVTAFEAENYLSSRGKKVVFTPKGKKENSAPEIWAIIVGVSNYRGDAIDLRYAAKDADNFATGFSVAARRLFGESKVHIITLTTQKDQAFQPTRAQIISTLVAARKAKPGDILMIYLAGHGVNYGGNDGDFYFLTSDASTSDLSDSEVRRLTGISSQELIKYINEIPAQKQVMILDTCASGRLVDKLMERREVSSSQIRALERVKDRTGLHILAGCASDSVSYEATSYGQGLLTHSLLLGMRGAALRDDEYVDVERLFSFAADQVPQLAKDIGGIQRPIIASPNGASFDIGRVANDDKAKIPLQSVRPMILRANLQDQDEIDDNLRLGRLVDEAHRDASVQGATSPLLFVDATEFPEAYRLSGRYRRDGDSVIVQCRLTRGKEKSIQFTVTGKTTQLQSLADKLRDAVIVAIKKTP